MYIHTEKIHNKRSATILLPILFDILNPGSVLDVGCGTATWLAVCSDLGITDYVGIDGNYVDTKSLMIPQSNFIATDLRETFDLNRKFDLVICLEVAEHLPPSSATVLVQNLVNHGDVILFSAAIPDQGGQNHLNEQWPEYWRALFLKHGYYFHDVIRPRIWENENIDWWYRQNIFLVNKTPPEANQYQSLSFVHPGLLKEITNDRLIYYNSLITGRQGLKLGVKIFFSSLIYKIRHLW